MSSRPLVRSPLSPVALVLLTGLAWAILGRSPGGGEPGTVLPPECQGLTPRECQALLSAEDSSNLGEFRDRVIPADEACVNAGYLCAEVERNGSLRLLRWQEATRLIRVLIPEPQGVSPDRRRQLQRAAVRGIQAWQGHPFPVSIRTLAQGEDPDMRIEWVQFLEEDRLGQAQTEWVREGDEVLIRVLAFRIATHRSRDPSVELTPKEVELVAAHEMGHILGLPHSDDPRDLMYPENTATQLSARDYRTLNALYALPNGVEIRR